MSMWFIRETTMTTVCSKPEDKKTNLTDSRGCPFFCDQKAIEHKLNKWYYKNSRKLKVNGSTAYGNYDSISRKLSAHK